MPRKSTPAPSAGYRPARPRRPKGFRTLTGRAGHAEAGRGADYTPEECELLRAADAYRRRTGRRFLSCTEVLALCWALGWRRAAPPGELPRGPRPTPPP